MKVGFMGTPDFAVPVLEALISAGHQICCVITQPDRARNRGKKVIFSPVKTAAVEHGIDAVSYTHLLEEESVRYEQIPRNI